MRSGQFSKNYGIAIITINNPPVKRCDCHVWLPNCRGNAARLNLSPQHTVQASWMSRNCSGSELLYAWDGFTLTAFNTHPHLNDVAMLIYH